MKSSSLVFNCILLAGVCGCACPHNVEERLCALEKECGLVDEPVDTAVQTPARISERPSLANLEPKIPFAEAAELAKKKDGKGYFALAVSYYYGTDVRTNDEIAKYFFEQSARTGNVNAEFALTLLSENEHKWLYGVQLYKDGRDNLSSRSGVLVRNCVERNHYQSLPRSNLLLRGPLPFGGCSVSKPQSLPLTNSVEVTALRDKYAWFLQKGILSASNEVARCDAWLWGYAEWNRRRAIEMAEKAAKEKAKKEREELRAKNGLLVETLLPTDLWIASTNIPERSVNRAGSSIATRRLAQSRLMSVASPVQSTNANFSTSASTTAPFESLRARRQRHRAEFIKKLREGKTDPTKRHLVE